LEFDTIYRETENYFGAEPSEVLEKYHHLIDRSGQVLDLGTGQGRNALFLARRGIAVHAIDPSRTAVDIVNDTSKKEGLPIRAERSGIETLALDAGPYSAILFLGLIPCLPRDKVEILGDRAARWITGSGLLFVTAFTVLDPSFARLSSEGEEIGRNSFVGREGRSRTFLEPGELVRLFPGFETVFLFEGLGKWHSHGENPRERHAVAEAVLRSCS